jgi:hypothetical protein
MKTKSGSGMNISDYLSESLETGFWVKNTFNVDLGSGIFLTRNPGWKNPG